MQQAIGPKMSVTLNYVGNHGSDLAALNPASTSIFGSFLGADASPRALQIRAQLTF